MCFESLFDRLTLETRQPFIVISFSNITAIEFEGALVNRKLSQTDWSSILVITSGSILIFGRLG